jgi:FO synthase subunit 1
MSAENEELIGYMKKASEIRGENHGNIVTYSKNVFIPVTNLCRNRCGYCGFRQEKKEASILTEKQVIEIAREGAEHNCKEALFTFGERPETYKKMKEFLKERGYENFLEYLHHLSEGVIKLGLLPHTNAGILDKEELRYLKDVNASMGLMLENASERLCGKGMPHEFSPGKNPKLRLKTIENAGRLRIPFTTGLLIGIGETDDEIIDSLLALKKVHDRYRHIQEIIIQNFKPKPNTAMEHCPEPSLVRLVKVVIAARTLFRNMSIQIPPNLNLSTAHIFLLCGANDLGGISPITYDYINPEAKWPAVKDLKEVVEGLNLKLRERLPIYPEFIKKGWYPEKIGRLIRCSRRR